MQNIKKYWKEIIIGILVIFSLNRCATACSRGTTINQNNVEYAQNIHNKDSIITVLNDSINVLNLRLQVYEEKISGLNQALVIQDEANRRIADAKKNIQVNVRQQQ